MSYRVCAGCDFVIDNGIHQDWDCPKCEGSEMRSPLDDDRNWDDLYAHQQIRYYEDMILTIEKRIAKLYKGI